MYQSSIGSCQNFSSQGGISFQKEKCGIVIKSSTWWEEKSLKVIGKTDGLINVGERDVYVKLGSKTESTADPSGVWHNFTMPDIKVCKINLVALFFAIVESDPLPFYEEKLDKCKQKMSLKN